MERKEIQRTVLQVLRYIFKRKDGVKRNPQDHLAGDDVSLKVLLELYTDKRMYMKSNFDLQLLNVARSKNLSL